MPQDSVNEKTSRAVNVPYTDRIGPHANCHYLVHSAEEVHGTCSAMASSPDDNPSSSPQPDDQETVTGFRDNTACRQKQDLDVTISRKAVGCKCLNGNACIP